MQALGSILSGVMMIIGLAILCLIFFILNRPRRRLKQWRQSLNLETHFQVFQKLYAGVDGFALSKEARVLQDAPEYTYGEIEFEPFIALLTQFKPNAQTVFYDLGSGVGKAVIACAMVFGIKKSCGIELFQNLHRCALMQRRKLSELNAYQAKVIEFQQGDFLEAQFEEANLLFINATAFFGDNWLKISQHLESLVVGSIVLSSSKPLLSGAYQLLSIIPIQMTWGVVKVYAQQKTSSN